MKDQSEQIRKTLLAAVKAELNARIESGKNQQELADQVGVERSFINSFLRDNKKGYRAVAIPRLIKIANGLGLDVELIIRKTGERSK